MGAITVRQTKACVRVGTGSRQVTLPERPSLRVEVGKQGPPGPPGVSEVQVIDRLDSTDTDNALSANQGRELDLKDAAHRASVGEAETDFAAQFSSMLS